MSNYSPSLSTVSSRGEQMRAWSAHLFTASGSVWGLLAILAITNERWFFAFGWMGVALFIDSFDGFLARRVRVKEVLPGFDGALLDNIVDYLNYVIVPALFLYEAGFLPPQTALLGAGLICMASVYQFCQSDAKTDDHLFTGFPSYWNIIVFYMFVLGLNPFFNLALTLLLTLLVFVPVRYVYPSRTKLLQPVTMAFGIVWGISCLLLLLQYPEPHAFTIAVSLAYVLYYTALSLYLTFNKDRRV